MSAKVFLGSVLVSLVIMAPLAYFILPMLYPNMDTDRGVLQSVYEEFDSEAWIADSTVAYELINDTELIITTQGDSSLAVLFSMQAVLSLDDTMVGALQFNISLVVQGVGSKEIRIAHYTGSPIGSYREIPVDATINYVTGVLPAGNYSVSVRWSSRFDLTGNNYLIAYTEPNYMFPRTLWVQEMRI